MLITKAMEIGAPEIWSGSAAGRNAYFGRLAEVAYDPDEDKQCYLCGRWLKMVGGTHIRWHGWTLAGYRRRSSFARTFRLAPPA
jgi:hypothetical protein